MKRTVFHVALGVAAFFAAHCVQATQSVYPAADAAGGQFTSAGANTWSVTRGAGQQLVFYGRYTSTLANESGLGLKIQYDAAKITNVAIDQVLTKCMLFTPDVKVNGATSEVLFGWADTSQRAAGAVGWPSLVDGTPPCINPDPPEPPIATTTAAFPAPTTLFRLTATTAAGFSSGSSTITISPTSASSAGVVPGVPPPLLFTNTSLVVNGVPPGGINFVQAVSRKAHGASNFDIPLVGGSLTSGTAITIDPRQLGTGFKIVFQFDAAVTSGTPSSSSGATSVSFSGNEATVLLTGVSNATRVQVNLNGVNGTTLDASAFVGLLTGDSGNNRSVTVTDILQTKGRSGQTTDATNFRSDFNASGAVSVQDILIVKGRSGTSLP